MTTVKTVAYFNKVLYNYLIGREGQTVDDKAFLKNIWMEAKGVEVMVDQYKKLGNDIANAEYLKHRLLNRLHVIYEKYLTANQVVNFDLRTFDKWIHNNAPHLYMQCNEFCICAPKLHISCPFVKLWREFKLNTSITFKIIRFYTVCRQIISQHKPFSGVVYFDK